MKYDILIAGVGGQGILLASDIISKAALKQGFNVKKAETHGMAQRGGSVVTHVRISDSEIYSPLIPKGKADIVIAFEPLEALRYLEYVSKNTRWVVNSNPIEILNYPDIDGIMSEIRGYKNSIIIDALEIAKKSGSILTQNIVILGVSSRYIPIRREILMKTIRETVRRAVDENLKAFELASML